MRKWTSVLCAAMVLATFAGCSETTPAPKSNAPISDPAAGDPANVQAGGAGGGAAGGGPGAGAADDNKGVTDPASTTPK